VEKDDFATPLTGADFLFSLDKIWCLVAEFGNQKQMGCECAIATCIFMGFRMVKFMQLYRSGQLQDVDNSTSAEGPCPEMWNIQILGTPDFSSLSAPYAITMSMILHHADIFMLHRQERHLQISSSKHTKISKMLGSFGISSQVFGLMVVDSLDFAGDDLNEKDILGCNCSILEIPRIPDNWRLIGEEDLHDI